MTTRGLATFAAAVAAAAGWLAAAWAGFLPLLWTALLLVLLALPQRRRLLFSPAWLAPGGAVLALGWLVAADHELAFRLTLLAVAAALLFGASRAGAAADRVIGLVAAGLALTALIAVAQACGGLGRLAALVPTLPAGWQAAAAARLATGRAFGTAALPGHYAALLVTVVPLLGDRLGRARGRGRAAWALLLVLAAVGVALTRSLAALGLAAVLLLALLWRHGAGRAAAGAAAVLAALAAAVLAARGDLASLEPLRLRLVNWRTAAWVFLHHPWLGVGLGGVGQAGLVAPSGAANITPYAHDTPLQLLAELGLAGLPLLVAAMWAVVRLLRLGWREEPALALAVAVVPLHNLVDFSAYTPELLLPWAVLAGALAARVWPPPRRPLPAAVLVALLAAGTIASTLAWRSEAATAAALAEPAPAAVATGALAAARWAPWTVTPLEMAAGAALAPGVPAALVARVDAALAARCWVQPRSSSWAEARARLQLALGHPGEALVWAREARRRAPWRSDLTALEAACRASR